MATVNSNVWNHLSPDPFPDDGPSFALIFHKVRSTDDAYVNVLTLLRWLESPSSRCGAAGHVVAKLVLSEFLETLRSGHQKDVAQT